MHSLLYDGRPSWRFWCADWVEEYGLSYERGEVCEELRKGIIVVLLLHEVRWRG